MRKSTGLRAKLRASDMKNKGHKINIKGPLLIVKSHSKPTVPQIKKGDRNMNFKKTRDKIKGFLLESGLSEVHFSKAQVPETLPAGIVSVAERFGDIKLMQGYANQSYKFDIHIVTEDSEEADEQLLSLIEYVDNELQGELYTEIDKVEFYDTLLSAKNIKIAKFEVVV